MIICFQHSKEKREFLQALLTLMDSKSFGYKKYLYLVFVGMLQGEGKEKEVMLGFLTLEAKVGTSSPCIENDLYEDGLILGSTYFLCPNQFSS